MVRRGIKHPPCAGCLCVGLLRVRGCASGCASEAPATLIAVMILIRSAMERARRSNLVTITTSPFRSDAIQPEALSRAAGACCDHVFHMGDVYDGKAPQPRFPPSVLWVVGPPPFLMGSVAFSHRILKKHATLPPALLLPGRHALMFLVLSNIIIFTTRNRSRTAYRPSEEWTACACLEGPATDARQRYVRTRQWNEMSASISPSKGHYLLVRNIVGFLLLTVAVPLYPSIRARRPISTREEVILEMT